MSALMDLASNVRQTRGYARFSALDAYPEFFDAADDATRVLALRDSDSTMYVIECTGAHAGLGIIDVHNSRSRISNSIAQVRKDIAANSDDDSGDDDLTAVLAELAVKLDGLEAELKSLVKTRAHVVTPVARTLKHYETPTPVNGGGYACAVSRAIAAAR